tara:strand:- start:11426 stop:11539 length:114 start_codon:yes stop_codon:yes gene_type:complete
MHGMADKKLMEYAIAARLSGGVGFCVAVPGAFFKERT